MRTIWWFSRTSHLFLCSRFIFTSHGNIITSRPHRGKASKHFRTRWYYNIIDVNGQLFPFWANDGAAIYGSCTLTDKDDLASNPAVVQNGDDPDDASLLSCTTAVASLLTTLKAKSSPSSITSTSKMAARKRSAESTRLGMDIFWWEEQRRRHQRISTVNLIISQVEDRNVRMARTLSEDSNSFRRQHDISPSIPTEKTFHAIGRKILKTELTKSKQKHRIPDNFNEERQFREKVWEYWCY